MAILVEFHTRSLSYNVRTICYCFIEIVTRVSDVLKYNIIYDTYEVSIISQLFIHVRGVSFRD